jgi:hypothetical protein
MNKKAYNIAYFIEKLCEKWPMSRSAAHIKVNLLMNDGVGVKLTEPQIKELRKVLRKEYEEMDQLFDRALKS